MLRRAMAQAAGTSEKMFPYLTRLRTDRTVAKDYVNAREDPLLRQLMLEALVCEAMGEEGT